MKTSVSPRPVKDELSQSRHKYHKYKMARTSHCRLFRRTETSREFNSISIFHSLCDAGIAARSSLKKKTAPFPSSECVGCEENNTGNETISLTSSSSLLQRPEVNLNRWHTALRGKVLLGF